MRASILLVVVEVVHLAFKHEQIAREEEGEQAELEELDALAVLSGSAPVDFVQFERTNALEGLETSTIDRSAGVSAARRKLAQQVGQIVRRRRRPGDRKGLGTAGCQNLIHRARLLQVRGARLLVAGLLDPVAIHRLVDAPTPPLQRHGRIGAVGGVVAREGVLDTLQSIDRQRLRPTVGARAREAEHHAHERDDHHRHDQELYQREAAFSGFKFHATSSV